jgi:hypothetical protein
LDADDEGICSPTILKKKETFLSRVRRLPDIREHYNPVAGGSRLCVGGRARGGRMRGPDPLVMRPCLVRAFVALCTMIMRAMFLFLTVQLGFSLEPVADFRLPDVNMTSPRSGEEVSPRDYLHRVTVYYFGAST